jgi:hypothetical protein
MKYIEPPTHRQPKYIPPNNKSPDYNVIRIILALGTILVLWLISQYVK